MSENVPIGADAVPPPATLLQMMIGYWVSQALYVVAKLGIDLTSKKWTFPKSRYRRRMFR